MNEATVFKKLTDAVINGEEEEVIELVRIVIEEKYNPLKAFNYGLVKGIRILGERFEKGEIFLPGLVVGADAMRAGNSLLNKEIIKAGLEKKNLAKVVIGTVEGDIHDIGKTLVSTMLSVNGFEVIDLGINNTSEQFIEVVRKETDGRGADYVIEAVGSIPTYTQAFQMVRLGGSLLGFGAAPATAGGWEPLRR